jgi:hypothetical protein
VEIIASENKGKSKATCYPNPLRRETAIQYTLTTETTVSLVIFNQLGQQIGTLVDERQQPGKHQVLWNAEGQSPGIYYHRLQAEGHQTTGKMVVIK